MLLGSFFFVYKSKATHKGEGPKEQAVDTAFEFLHNTFGEFLTAEFFIRKIWNETDTLYQMKKIAALKSELEQKLSNPDRLPDTWYVNFMYAPLYSRPVILEMLREWSQHKLRGEGRTTQDFLEDLDSIIFSHINLLLTSNNIPRAMRESGNLPFPPKPVIGHLAIYTLNLITLRTVLSPQEYVFNEMSVKTQEDGTRTWDRLSYLWRSWFSLDSLNALSAILTAKRIEDRIYLRTKETFALPINRDKLDSVINVSNALADNISAGLAEVLSHDPFGDPLDELLEGYSKLRSEGIDAKSPVDLKLLQRAYFDSGIKENYEELLDTFNDVFQSTPMWRLSSLSYLMRLITSMHDVRFAEKVYQTVPDPTLEADPDFPITLVIDTLNLLKNGFYVDAYRWFRSFRQYFNKPSRKDLRPEEALELVIIEHEIGAMHFYQSFISEDEILSLPFNYLVERFPVLTVKFVNVFRSYDDKLYAKLAREVIKYLPPERGVEIGFISLPLLLHMIRKHADLDVQRTYLENIIRREMSVDTIPNLLFEALLIAKNINDKNFIRNFLERLVTEKSSSTEDGEIGLRYERYIDLSTLPLGMLNDIRQLAKEYNPRMFERIERLLNPPL